MSIDLYVKQLAEDLRSAAQNVTQKPDEIPQSSEDSFLEHIRDVENYLYGDSVPLSEILGIATIQLPPPEKLNKQQQSLLYQEMEMLMSSYNFYPDFPKNLPSTFKYKIMRENWDKESIYMESGQTTIEFCQYEPAECPFPQKYCSCKDSMGEYNND